MSPFNPKNLPTPQTLTTTTGVKITVNHAPPPEPTDEPEPEEEEEQQPRHLVFPPNQSARDRDAFIRALNAEHGAFLRRTMTTRWGVLPESTKDICQDVLVTAWKQLDKLPKDERPTNVRGWLVTLAWHQTGNHKGLWRPDIDRGADMEATSSPASDPERKAQRAERWAKLERYLLALPPNEAEAVRYVDLYELTLKEAAELLGRSDSTLGDQVARGRAKIKDLERESERATAAGERRRPAR